MLKHTLVYQVEHVFLIHRHTGLLISHVTAENAGSQDPQLVSSMLVAIQDFVQGFVQWRRAAGARHAAAGRASAVVRAGPFATLVAVIRGDPPEGLHETLRKVLSRIHSERHHALESFDGDSAGFADVEAQLRECVTLGKRAPPRLSLRWLVGLLWLVPVLLFAGALVARSWQDQRLWDGYLERLRAQPGIVITEQGKRDGKFQVSGLRDPFAIDPQLVLRELEMDPQRVVTSWVPYQALDPELVLRRLNATLEPPPSVTLAIADGRIVAQGSAPSRWLDRARAVAPLLPAGATVFDFSAVRNADEADELRWAGYVARLRATPGIVITQAEQHDGNFLLAGLRDPLAVDPLALLSEAGIDPARVVARFEPYQGLDPEFVLKRLLATLVPPPGVTLAVEGNRIVAQGSASSPWLERARVAGRLLPAGAPALDLSAVRNINDGELGKMRDAIQSRNIRFDNNVSLPAAGQDAILDQVASELKELAALSSSLHVTTRVTLAGHSDDKGQGTSNLSLSWRGPKRCARS